MPHGARAWSNVGADELVYGLSDMAELAVRLGSPDAHNREGNVILLETFEHGLGGWLPAGYGTGAAVIVSAESYRSSGYACKLIAGSTDIAAAKIFRNLPLPVLGRYGLEISWRPEAHLARLLCRLAYIDGSQEHQYNWMYVVSGGLLQIQPAGGGWTTIASALNLVYSYAGFQTIKLVADLASLTYVRLILNEAEYDLSDYEPYSFANTDAPHVRADVVTYGDAGYNGYVYVDDVILTQNEPA